MKQKPTSKSQEIKAKAISPSTKKFVILMNKVLQELKSHEKKGPNQ